MAVFSKHLPYGKKHQVDVLSSINDNLASGSDLAATVKFVEGQFKIPRRTVYRWWKHFKQWGEAPYETNAKKKKIRFLT